MSYVIQMKGFWQYLVKQNYDAMYICQLEDRNCNWRQGDGEFQMENKEHADIVERDHLQRFLLVARVLFI